jgi:ABC-type phosphate transport system permease subunit
MAPAAAASLVVALGLGMTAAVYLRLRRRGHAAKATPTFWLLMVGMSVISGVCSWAFATGRPGIGIGVLIAAYVLPEFVLMPLRIRRSRAAAEAARSARKARRSSSRATREASDG